MTVGQGSAPSRPRCARAGPADSRGLLCEVNLGATAIGTGITAHPGYRRRAVQHLADITGLPVMGTGDLVGATSDTGAFVRVFGVLKRVVVKASKIRNDLRLLGSGPRRVSPSSSSPPARRGRGIMPGKGQPGHPGDGQQVAFWVIGNDLTVTMAAGPASCSSTRSRPVGHGLLRGFAWTRRPSTPPRAVRRQDHRRPPPASRRGGRQRGPGHRADPVARLRPLRRDRQGRR